MVAFTVALFGVGAVETMLIAVPMFGIANNKAAGFKPLTTPVLLMLKVKFGMLAVTLRAVLPVPSLTETVMLVILTAMLVFVPRAAQLLEIAALVIASCTLNELGVNGMLVVRSAKVALALAVPCPATCGRNEAPVALKSALITAPLKPMGLSTLIGGINPQLAKMVLNPRAAPNNTALFIYSSITQVGILIRSETSHIVYPITVTEPSHAIVEGVTVGEKLRYVV